MCKILFFTQLKVVIFSGTPKVSSSLDAVPKGEFLCHQLVVGSLPKKEVSTEVPARYYNRRALMFG
jgi:hypothetical protein